MKKLELENDRNTTMLHYIPTGGHHYLHDTIAYYMLLT